MKQLKSVMLGTLALCLSAVLIYSGYQVWKTNDEYENESRMHEKVLEYKPEQESEKPSEAVNQSILDLQKTYPDVVGWLTIPNTGVDYPFVRCENNDYYLRRDLDGKYAFAGTLFMDYRCKQDFTSQNTIIYGHHMKNESMFGSLQSFNGKSFFEENRYGTVYLPGETLKLEFFAYMVLDPDKEKEIYNVYLAEDYFDYIKKNARYYRAVGVTADEQIITLSTCAYEFKNARMVLIARVYKNDENK